MWWNLSTFMKITRVNKLKNKTKITICNHHIWVQHFTNWTVGFTVCEGQVPISTGPCLPTCDDGGWSSITLPRCQACTWSRAGVRWWGHTWSWECPRILMLQELAIVTTFFRRLFNADMKRVIKIGLFNCVGKRFLDAAWEYRIARNFSEIETLTIFASRHENAKV